MSALLHLETVQGHIKGNKQISTMLEWYLQHVIKNKYDRLKHCNELFGDKSSHG